jgi:endonuclease/exonuclease/phosphatase family metal-dependent hydrolase
LDAIHEVDATAVLGDFNEEAEAPGRRVLAEAGFVDTYDEVRARCRKTFPSYTTFTPEGSSGGPKIDAIYVKGLKTEWTCVDEIIKKDVFISDHLPVHAVVSWAPVRE